MYTRYLHITYISLQMQGSDQMSKPESGLDEVKRSRDYYRKEIEDKEREIVALRKQIDTIREKLPAKQKILDDLNEIIAELEGKE